MVTLQSNPTHSTVKKEDHPTFTPNVDIMKVFHSKVMLINDVPNCENGQVLIKAGADGPPIHTHPEQEEYFRIIKGQLDVYRGDRWITLHANQDIYVPRNTPHSYRSRHSEDCIFEYQLTPRRNFSLMMQTFERLTNEGKLKSTSDLKSMIYMAMVFRKFKNEVVSVNPPSFVMTILACFGKVFGFKI